MTCLLIFVDLISKLDLLAGVVQSDKYCVGSMAWFRHPNTSFISGSHKFKSMSVYVTTVMDCIVLARFYLHTYFRRSSVITPNVCGNFDKKLSCGTQW